MPRSSGASYFRTVRRSTVQLLAASAIIGIAYLSRRMLQDLLSVQRIRVDAKGDGHFGTGRAGHTHQGVDLVVTPGSVVTSPITGRVVRITHAYPNDANYLGVVLQGEGLEVKVFYITPELYVAPGVPIGRGDAIGIAQNIAAKYGPPMIPHIHVEVRRTVGAQLLDPTPMLRLV